MTPFRTELAGHLRSMAPPWAAVISSVDCPPASRLESSLPGFRVVTVDGEQCRTKTTALVEFAARLDFPPYFGHNWDAFEECLRDLAWMPAPGYVIVVNRAENILTESARDYSTFIDILSSAGEQWASPRSPERERSGVPFHALLVPSSRGLESRDWRVARLDIAPPRNDDS